MVVFIYIILLLIFIIFIINIYLYRVNILISNLEKKVLILFNNRFLLVPGFFEISKGLVNKHSDVFKEILKLFKGDSISNYNSISFQKRQYIVSLLNHEFEFIFKILSKKLENTNNFKYLYLKDISENNLIKISDNIKIYDKYIKKYNTLVKINNMLLIGYFIPSNIEK